MKTNLSAPQTLYLGRDVPKAEIVIAILESERDAEPRPYGFIATIQHAIERAMRRIAKSHVTRLACSLFANHRQAYHYDRLEEHSCADPLRPTAT
jgi:hypothetical protein